MLEKTADAVAATEHTHLVDELLAGTLPREETEGAPTSLVGECIDERHPVLTGRVRVRWQNPDEGTLREQWLPCLHGLTVRKADRVLVLHPGNWPEPVVVGIVDGFARRPATQFLPGPSLTLERDESVRIVTREGQPLIEVCQEESGPVVRLLSDDVDLDIKGRFKVKAQRIDLDATAGSIKIAANNDVVVQGEMVRLN